MNRQARLVFYWGIVLLVSVVVFVSVASAAPEDDSARLSSRVMAAQPPPPTVYTLTVNIAGSGSGTVLKNPTGPQYLANQVVQLNAQPAGGSVFGGWSGGGLSGSTNPTSITMITNTVITATFNAATCYTLTTTIAPPAGGSVNPNPAPNCGAQYTSGTSVILGAVANSGYAFSNWTTCDAPSGASCTMAMTTNKSVTANFVPCYTLTVNRNPIAGGSVTINTAPNCGTQYASGASVSLTAVAAGGYSFRDWTGCDVPAGANCTMNMSTNKTVTANFTVVSSSSSSTGSSSSSSVSSSSSAASSSSQAVATITPLLGGGGATATLTPRPTTALPDTGSSPLTLVAIGLVLILIVVGARALRQSSV